MQQRTAGDVDVGVGVGDFFVLGQDARSDFSKGANDFEILVVRAKTLTKGKLDGCPRIFGPEHSVPKPKHRPPFSELVSNKGFNLVRVAGSDSQNEFKARLVRSTVKRPGESAFMAPAMDA